jgi:hypothetical protein
MVTVALEPRVTVRPVVAAAGPSHEPRWSLASECAEDWSKHLARLGGGFFHSPVGTSPLALGASDRANHTERLFAQLHLGDGVAGLAVGSLSRCRFSARPRHVYFPTPPLVPQRPLREAALGVLVDRLRELGAAEVMIDARDALWQPGSENGANRAPRYEYVVPLDARTEDLTRRLSRAHLRLVRRGELERWTMARHEGSEAWALFARRWTTLPPSAGGLPTEAGGWGVTAFSAWLGGTPIAAVLVGCSSRRVYCLRSRLTPAGEAHEAAVWLHWRVLCHLSELGFRTCTLGGTSASASLPRDPEHQRFQLYMGFGPELVSRRVARFTLRPTHMGTHLLVGWLADRWSA